MSRTGFVDHSTISLSLWPTLFHAEVYEPSPGSEREDIVRPENKHVFQHASYVCRILTEEVCAVSFMTTTVSETKDQFLRRGLLFQRASGFGVTVMLGLQGREASK